jgi:hypothetical protein
LLVEPLRGGSEVFAPADLQKAKRAKGALRFTLVSRATTCLI